MDYSLRIPATNERIRILEELKYSKKMLPSITDTMYKPTGVDLRNYHPNNVCLRLREFEDGVKSLMEIKTLRVETGYSDSKINLDLNDLNKYEKWGKMSTTSTEYKIVMNDHQISVLQQRIDPVGEFLKIETPTVESMQAAIKLFEIEDGEKIERNAAVLLGEHLKLI